MGPVARAIAGDPEHPANFGRLCSKGAALGETLGLDGRLLHPAIGNRRVGWDEALDHVTSRPASHHPYRTDRSRWPSICPGSC